MQFREIKGFTRKLAEEQPEYETLAIRDTIENYDFKADGIAAIPFMWFEVTPTPEELARLNAGESVFVSIMGCQFPPVSVQVGDPIDWPAAELAAKIPTDDTGAT